MTLDSLVYQSSQSKISTRIGSGDAQQCLREQAEAQKAADEKRAAEEAAAAAAAAAAIVAAASDAPSGLPVATAAASEIDEKAEEAYRKMEAAFREQLGLAQISAA